MSIPLNFNGHRQGSARDLLFIVGLWVGLVSACQARPTVSIPPPATADTRTPPAAATTATPGPTATSVVATKPTAAPFVTPTRKPTEDTSPALSLAIGPHLFLDDYLIAYREHVTRRV